MGELRFFRDPDCLSQIDGMGFGYDSDTADAQRAYDGEPLTFWHGDCCVGKFELDGCTGCEADEALLGINLITNESMVQCLQLIQAGVPQFRGQPMFTSERVSLLQWNGISYDVVYTW